MMQFRRQRGLMFLDESGQFPPRPGELPLVASLLVPDNPKDRARLAEMGGLIRSEALLHPESRGRAKPHFLPEWALERVASVVRENWFLGWDGITPSPGRMKLMYEAFSTLPALVVEMRSKLKNPADRADLRIDFLISEIRRAVESHSEYFALVHQSYLHAARWFRQNGILPDVHAYLDEKLPRRDVQLHDFLIRFCFGTTFQEFYEGRLASLLGVYPCPQLRAEVSTDDECDGLAVVGVIAWIRGMIDRGMDRDGRFQRLFGLMTRSA